MSSRATAGLAGRLLAMAIITLFALPAGATPLVSPRPSGDDAALGRLETRFERRIEAIRAGGVLKRGVTSMHVVEAATGRVVYSAEADRLMNPASNVKLIATSTALSVLGPKFRYETRVLAPAPDETGVINGEVWVVGTGDPLLNEDHLIHLVDALKAAGVKRIRGTVRLGPRVRIADPEPVELTVVVSSGQRPGDPLRASVEPASRFVVTKTWPGERVQEAALVVRSMPTGRSNTGPVRIHVKGVVPAGERVTRHLEVTHPGLATAATIAGALDQAGIGFPNPVRPLGHATPPMGPEGEDPQVLARHRSIPCSELVAMINKRSDNRLADHLLTTAGSLRFGGAPTLGKGVGAMYLWLRKAAGIQPKGIVLDTGSGLSYKTRLSTRHITRVLRTALGYRRHAKQSGHRRGHANVFSGVFRESLAIAGRDGTLRGRFARSPALRKRVLGKSGTLTEIIALSGLITVKDAPPLIFSIVSNGTRQDERFYVRRRHEVLVECLYYYLRARRQ